MALMAQVHITTGRRQPGDAPRSPSLESLPAEISVCFQQAICSLIREAQRRVCHLRFHRVELQRPLTAGTSHRQGLDGDLALSRCGGTSSRKRLFLSCLCGRRDPDDLSPACL